ncbi:unnamed protein product [Rotaria sp. Silwood1]|nr:unnamed protein product [Rotaria sp. Silwood1]CAF0953196.1 unnamed protein product [Rotaria sp. Silwood1]CAF3372700.1 unnamed protein product [Rotaria sp. Silwood1]CAF4635124.1 unnamed protein product [Rotaria sp. Silwood1]
MFDLLQSTETVYYDAEQGQTSNRTLSRDDKEQFDIFQSFGKQTDSSTDIPANRTRSVKLESLPTSSYVVDNQNSTDDQQLASPGQLVTSHRRKKILLYGLFLLILVVVITAVTVTLILVLRSHK